MPFTRSTPAATINRDADALPPSAYGLPSKYSDWRQNQLSAVDRILTSDKRFIALCCPTGFGKSVVIAAAAAMSGQRCAVLTMTKGLQDQYQEFAPADIRGLSNYTCPIADQLGIPVSTPVADAPCQCGYLCKYRRSGCGYYDDYRKAQHSDTLCTNYSCWLYDGRKQASEQSGNLQFGVDAETTGDRPISILFCDEAHEIVGALSDFIGEDISRRECLQLHLPWPDSGGSVDDWQCWAIEQCDGVSDRLKDLDAQVRNGGGKGWTRELKHLRDMKRKLERLSAMQSVDEWIISESDVNASAGTMASVRFDPLSPARYAEQALFRGIEKVVLVSATVRPKTASMLGIASSELEFVEYPSTFPVERRPIVHIPTIRMTYRNEQDDGLMREWLQSLDAWIGPRLALGRKGLIHAVSYRRMKFIADNSEHKQYMMTHTAGDRARVVEEFRRSGSACCLISPSIDTGYDFKGSQAYWQVIAKLPFASTQDPVVKARQDRDRDYGLYQVAQTLVQATGRIVRCFDLSTEILTKRGWKGYKDICAGDVTYGVASFDQERQVMRNGAVLVKPNPIYAVQVNAKPERVLKLYACKGVDIVVTPDHSMVVKINATRNLRKMSSRGLTQMAADKLPARFKIINAGYVSRLGPNIERSLIRSREWFRLMGIIISDGHVSKTKSVITICQSKPHIKPWITGLLDRLGLRYKMYDVKGNRAGTVMEINNQSYVRNHDMTNWVISGTDASRIRDIFDRGHHRRHSKKKLFRRRRHKGTHGYAWVDGWKDIEKTIPRWVLERASVNQMKALLEGLMIGDGSPHTGGSGGNYFTSSSQLADRLQELLTLSGYKSHIYSRRGQFEVSYCTKGFTDCVHSTTISEGGKARTWCVNTEMGTVIARRHGRVFISGNSESDWGETLIADQNCEWALPRMFAKGFIPKWWRASFRSVDVVPAPIKFDHPVEDVEAVKIVEVEVHP